MKEEKKAPKKLPLYVSLLWIVGSVFLFSGTSFGLFRGYRQHRTKKLLNPKFHISKIIQTGSQKEALKTSYLAELMDLSVDKKINIHLFDEIKTEQKLLLSPLIQSARVKKIKPNTIYVDYEIRRPIAHLLDYENTLIDIEGYIFPNRPFFSSPKLPKIYLGSKPFGEEGSWHRPLATEQALLALELLQILETEEFPFRVKQIDVSNAYLRSYGRREVVLIIEEEIFLPSKNGDIYCKFPKILRLSPKNYSQQIGNFLVLREKMLDDYRQQIREMDTHTKKMEFAAQVIDFRIDELAFIQEGGE